MTACAVLMLSLGPTLSLAFLPAAPNGWVEICSAKGARLVQVDHFGSAAQGAADKQGPVKPDAHAAQHCQSCTGQAQLPGLPPAALLMHSPTALPSHVPALLLAAPRTLFAWASPQSRAPPVAD